MLSFDRTTYDSLIDHSISGQPEEVCGILGGKFTVTKSRVTIAYQTSNVADNPETRYYIDPMEQLNRIDAIEESGDDVVGFYHSHPNGPTIPSETDAERATWPGYSYVIVALDGQPFMGSWRWNDESSKFEQEVVQII